MTAQLLPWPRAKFFAPNTNYPLAGGKVYTYVAGTSTPLATFSDYAGVTPNTNPVVLDANGEAPIYLGAALSYKINITDASDVQIPGYPVDNIIGAEYSGAAAQVLTDLANTSNVALGDALVGVKSILTGGVARTQHEKNADVVSVYDFIPAGTTDYTTSIQAAINAAMAAGKTLDLGDGTFLCGALTVDATLGARIVGRGCKLVPNANGVTFFTVSNAQTNKPSFIGGFEVVGTGKTGINIVSVADFTQFYIGNIVARSVDYVLNASASAGGSNSYNIGASNITIFGSGSFAFNAAGTKRIFDVQLTNISQFTTGGDTWVGPMFQFTRCVNVVVDNINTQSLSGAAMGIRVIGQCEGIFFSNSIIVWPTYGILVDKSNGDATQAAWIYLNNVGLDQPTINGADFLATHVRLNNVNITSGTARTNSGSGLIMRTGTVDYGLANVQIGDMYHDGLTLEAGVVDGKITTSTFTENATSGVGYDVNVAGITPRDPFFTACRIGTKSYNGTDVIINGGGTSRYVCSARSQLSSSAPAVNQVLYTFTLPANTFVDGKTLRITASGTYAANGNAKAVVVTVGGVTVASMSSTFNGVAWSLTGEILRVDASNVWLVGNTWAGITTNITSVLQNPFSSAAAIIFNLVVSGTGAADVVMHHFDVELID